MFSVEEFVLEKEEEGHFESGILHLESMGVDALEFGCVPIKEGGGY